MPMRFYGYFRSSAAYRCRIAFNLKGIEPAFVGVHLRRDGGQHKAAGYRAINPQGLVPALEIDGRILTQSLAIIEWLDETHPEPPLLPADSFGRARVRGFALAIAADIHPINNLRVLGYLRSNLNADEAAVNSWVRHWIEAGFEACEKLVLRSTESGGFCFGNTPTLADICLIPQLYNARRYDCDLSRYPNLVAIGARCNALPAFGAALPEKQPDAEP